MIIEIKVEHIVQDSKEIIERLLELCLILNIKPKLKGRKHMDVLATIAAIQTAVNALKAGTATPTANFATPDVQSALTALASSVGVTPTSAGTPAS